MRLRGESNRTKVLRKNESVHMKWKNIDIKNIK